MKTYTSREVSAITGLSIPTLRYYESIGLLDSVQRADNSHRRYSDDDLRRIEFLKRVRATGMSISEMGRYVDLFRAGDETLAQRLDVLLAHRQRVQAQMDALADTLDFLDAKIARYHDLQAQQAAMPEAAS
ncbi:MAG: MerR family transcriptional regulator [Pleurocapsa minor GSE-CHR-MK-17-07R]|jgi:DNA-binding transcriptional MerR regulator|nr:MerR family transcriptional regulator [Pleurocapsa minor GSE-CHR-MK 17-07R]